MIKIENLTFNYPKQKELFNSLDLQLKDGSVHGLLGKNGAGKTTLLKIIAGLRFPKDGFCRAFGYDTHKRYPDFLKKLYFIPEEFYTPSISLKEFIRDICPLHNNGGNVAVTIAGNDVASGEFRTVTGTVTDIYYPDVLTDDSPSLVQLSTYSVVTLDTGSEELTVGGWGAVFEDIEAQKITVEAISFDDVGQS